MLLRSVQLRGLSDIVTPTFLHVYVAHFFSATAFHLIVLFPLFVTFLGGDDLDIGLLTAVAAAGGIALRWLAGPFWGRVPRRALFLAGGILELTGFLLLLGVGNLGSGIYVARLLLGAGMGLLFGAYFTYASDIVPAGRRVQGIGIFGTSGMAAAYAGVWLGERVLMLGGFRAFFLAGAGAALLALVLALTLPEKAEVHAGAADDRNTSRRPRTSRRSDEPPAGFRRFVAVWGIAGCFGIATTAAMSFLAPFAEAAGLRPIAPFFLAYSGTAIALRFLAGALPDRIGRRRVLWPALTLFSIGLFAVPFARDQMALLITGILCGAGHGYAFPILNAMVVDRTRDRRGPHVGLFTSFIDLGGLIGAPVLGLIARQAGYAALFRVASLWLFLCMTLLLVADLRLDRRRGGS
jgi:MFS family permease